MIYIKSQSQIDKMKKSAAVLVRVLREIEKAVEPGVTTEYLDKIAGDIIKANNAFPSFKGQPGMTREAIPFPACICASVNDEIIHGIPSKTRILQEGDIISIDAGVLLDGYHSDAARTIRVGKVSDIADKLIDVTKQSFFEGVVNAVPGNRISDIGGPIQMYAEKNGFSVVRDFVGHGVGEDLHEDPEVPNYLTGRKGARLEKGMTIAIEPMVNEGTYEIRINRKNGWTVYTADGKLSAHYENTIVITDNGPDIITLDM